MNMWINGINIVINKQKYIIFNCYHSPNSSHTEFLSKLEEIMIDWVTNDSILILVGDFNINIAKTSYYSDKLTSVIKSLGLYQLMDRFTRVTKDSSTIIDLVVTNKKDLKYKVHTTPKISDHSIITIELLNNYKIKPYHKKVRIYKDINENNFQDDLKETEWNILNKDTDSLSNHLVNTVLTCLNNHAPEKDILVDVRWGHNKWWTNEIKLEIKNRDTKYKRAIITGTEEDWNEFKKTRNNVVTLIRNQKKSYYNEKIDEVKNDSEEMWKTLKLLVYGKNKNIVVGIKFAGKLYENKEEISELFNNYFLDSIEDITLSLNKTNKYEEILNSMEKHMCTFNKFKLINVTELKKIVNDMKNKKSSVDGINMKILKMSIEAIGDRFLEVINSSLESGKFPEAWKISTIIPIEKKANTINGEEHRPLNMVPSYEKLLETVVNEQLIDYCESHKLLSKHQAGFRRNNSCECALQTILYDWKRAINNKLIIGVVYLDFQRAFETIDRDLLVLKLENLGIKDAPLKWFKSYLSDRSQVTKYDGMISKSRSTKHGVPQGTVLGPSLFVIYINDIVQHKHKCDIQLFADDTLLYCIGENVDKILLTLNEEINLLEEWLSENSLKINTSKTKYMIIKNKYNVISTQSNIDVCIYGNKIELVNEYKYLGVIIDDQLSFSKHAGYVTSKIAKKINLLGRISNVTTQWTRTVIYKSIISPHLNYCSSILFLLNNSELDKLQKKQNQAMRIILKCSKYTNIRLMLNNVGVLSVKQTITFNTMTFIYKILHGQLPVHLSEYCIYVRDIHQHMTRNRNDLYITTVRTNYGQNDLYHKGMVMYNSLPEEIKMSQTIQAFKRQCYTYIHNNVDV